MVGGGGQMHCGTGDTSQSDTFVRVHDSQFFQDMISVLFFVTRFIF